MESIDEASGCVSGADNRFLHGLKGYDGMQIACPVRCLLHTPFLPTRTFTGFLAGHR
jgi:hypothetical protein